MRGPIPRTAKKNPAVKSSLSREKVINVVKSGKEKKEEEEERRKMLMRHLLAH